MPHLSPTTLTTDEQRLILCATAGNVRDHLIYSLAFGTGLCLTQREGHIVKGPRLRGCGSRSAWQTMERKGCSSRRRRDHRPGSIQGAGRATR